MKLPRLPKTFQSGINQSIKCPVLNWKAHYTNLIFAITVQVSHARILKTFSNFHSVFNAVGYRYKAQIESERDFFLKEETGKYF